MPISPSAIPAGPPVPDSSLDEPTFDAQFEASLAWQKNILQPGMNDAAAATYANAVESASAAVSALDSAAVALVASNFKGDWTGKTGAANMPASYRHAGKYWALVTNIAASPGIQAKTPGVAPEFALLPTADTGQPNTWTAAQTFAGGVVVSGGALGYGPGAGGTVTQATNKGTSVALNKPCGKIFIHPQALAANTSAAFLFSNATITGTDLLSVGVEYAGGIGDRYAARASTTVGGAVIYVQNLTTGTLSESPTIAFSVTKGATA